MLLLSEPLSEQVQQAIRESDRPVEVVQFSWDRSQSLPFLSEGYVNGQRVSAVWRDTGCSCVLVSEDVLSKPLSDKSPRVTLCDYMGNPKEFPTERIYLKCGFFEGFTRAVIVPLKFCRVIVGNIPGV